MARFVVRAAVLTLWLATLAAGPVAAGDIIKKGVDFWVTRPNGTTQFVFPFGDVESLCKAPPDSTWNHRVVLRGVPAPGADWDSAVARLRHAKFDGNGVAETEVQFVALSMVSMAPTFTPCGRLDWQARLAKGPQPVTPMKIVKATPGGGTFSAELALRIEMQANDATTAAYVGSLFYDVKLPDPAGGTPWSFGTAAEFRPGMTETDDCIAVLRDKLGTFPPGSSHIYFISNLIAQGKCSREN
jgi:hypothetical protein